MAKPTDTILREPAEGRYADQLEALLPKLQKQLSANAKTPA